MPPEKLGAGAGTLTGIGVGWVDKIMTGTDEGAGLGGRTMAGIGVATPGDHTSPTLSGRAVGQGIVVGHGIPGDPVGSEAMTDEAEISNHATISALNPIA